MSAINRKQEYKSCQSPMDFFICTLFFHFSEKWPLCALKWPTKNHLPFRNNEPGCRSTKVLGTSSRANGQINIYDCWLHSIITNGQLTPWLLKSICLLLFENRFYAFSSTNVLISVPAELGLIRYLRLLWKRSKQA